MADNPYDTHYDVKFNPNDRYWPHYSQEIKIIGVTLNDDQKVHSCLGCHCVACATKHAELQERLSYLEELVVCMSRDIANIRNADKANDRGDDQGKASDVNAR